MEQQNQQPMQGKTYNKPRIQVNWKFISIVALIAVVVSVAGILLLLPLLKIDKCFDNGGRWDYEKSQCQEFTRQPCDLDIDGDCDGNDYEVFSKSVHMCSRDNSVYLPNVGFIRGYNPLADANHDECVALDDKELLFPNRNQEEITTANWQTYRNDEFGFEVRYPESFLRKEFPARTNEGVFGVSLKDKKYQEGHYPTLNVVVIKTSLSPREWLEEYYDPAGPPILGDIPEPPTGYENVEEIAINGIPALRFRLLAPSDSSLSTIIQGKPGTLYHVQAISSGLGNFPRELHDQILATFRFIK